MGVALLLGAFDTRRNAEEGKAEAERAGFEVSVVEAPGPGGSGVLFKVMSPVFGARAQAEEQLAKFKSGGFPQAFVVRATR